MTDSKPTRSNDFLGQRLQSLDAYRGLIMVALAFNGFGIAGTAAKMLEANPDSAFWSMAQHQFSHVQWIGCAFWDLIQPSFMFMVGASMAYSYVNRKKRGQSYRRMLLHAFTRALILIALGVFLGSAWAKQTNWSFTSVLAQIGLGYGFLFLLWGRSLRAQAITAAALLLATWILFVACPTDGINLKTGNKAVSVSAEWAQTELEDVSPSWHKNANAFHAADLAFLNLFPREQPFEFNNGGYQTLNFIPALATMIFGLMCGELLRSSRAPMEKLRLLAIAGFSGVLVGGLLNIFGICPVVKRIWSPSWALYSTGICVLILAALYAIIDVKGYRRWAFPFVVVGLNSIFIYCMAQMLKPWTGRQLQTHLGKDVFKVLGDNWEPFVQFNLIGLCFWLICYAMYRQRLFIRI